MRMGGRVRRGVPPACEEVAAHRDVAVSSAWEDPARIRVSPAGIEVGDARIWGEPAWIEVTGAGRKVDAAGRSASTAGI